MRLFSLALNNHIYYFVLRADRNKASLVPKKDMASLWFNTAPFEMSDVFKRTEDTAGDCKLQTFLLAFCNLSRREGGPFSRFGNLSIQR